MTEVRADMAAAMAELCNVDIEASVLAAVLLDNRQMAKARDLSPDDFALPSHGAVWRVVMECWRTGEDFDPLSLRGRCGDGVTDAMLATLAGAHMGNMGVPSWVATIQDLANRRRLIAVAGDMIDGAGDRSRAAAEIAMGAASEFQSIAAGAGKRAMTTRETLTRLADDLARPLPRFSTGLRGLDRATAGGFYAGKMYGIRARMKAGKTLLLGTLSHNLNTDGVPHLFVTMEMSPAEIEQRNTARALDFNAIRFLTRDDPRLPTRVADYAATAPDNVMYEHRPGATLSEIHNMIGGAMARHDIKGVVVDYLQLVGGKTKTETEESHLRNVAQSLADIARRENLFVIVASQMNQEGNTRGGEGLNLACDQLFSLHRDIVDPAGWLTCDFSRYTIAEDVGSATEPGLWLHRHGPHFVDFDDRNLGAAA